MGLAGFQPWSALGWDIRQWVARAMIQTAESYSQGVSPVSLVKTPGLSGIRQVGDGTGNVS